MRRSVADGRSHSRRKHHCLARCSLRETRRPTGEPVHRSRRVARPPIGCCNAPHPLLPMSIKPAADLPVSAQPPLNHETTTFLLMSCFIEGLRIRSFLQVISPGRSASTASGRRRFVRKSRGNRLRSLRVSPHFSHFRCPAPVQNGDRAGERRRAMWFIGQAVRRTLSPFSTDPKSRLAAAACERGPLNRMARYAFRVLPSNRTRRKATQGAGSVRNAG